MRVLVVNCGSSSIKFAVVDVAADRTLANGIVERVGEEVGTFRWRHLDTEHTDERPFADHRVGVRAVIDALATAGLADDLAAVGHRVVHGGADLTEPTVIDRDVVGTLRSLIPLAPLHNPANILGIEALIDLRPELPQVAVFDTAFHATIPPRARRYAVPEWLLRDHAIQRYGFHGTSHRYVSRRAAEHLGRDPSEVDLITLHLGNGASAAAIRGGVCIDTSMGLSPLEGLVMGTRSGDLDPAVVFYLADRAGMSIAEIDTLLNRQSGLKGLAGVNDMREIERRADAGDADAELARTMFCYRAAKYVGAYTAALGRLDALVFTAGIGQHEPGIRRRICAGLGVLGIAIDDASNDTATHDRHPVTISLPDAPVAVLVVPTDEEREIARQTADLLGTGDRGH